MTTEDIHRPGWSNTIKGLNLRGYMNKNMSRKWLTKPRVATYNHKRKLRGRPNQQTLSISTIDGLKRKKDTYIVVK